MTHFPEQCSTQTEQSVGLVARELPIRGFSQAIWEAMEEAGLSKADLANLIGATQDDVSEVLSGSRNMALRTLFDICFALGLKLRVIVKRDTTVASRPGRPRASSQG
jgi:transcriptional regulator with XRE-family HTH domain